MSAPAANHKVALLPLELTGVEMHICRQWLGEYAKLDTKTDRTYMLGTKILPRLKPLNNTLSEDAWRVRKSDTVSFMLQSFKCFNIYLYLFVAHRYLIASTRKPVPFLFTKLLPTSPSSHLLE
ncbi:hypothetical protein BYT27DRAFT_7208808 [Phlegmacium glaucopus]|nr:hypothetical protein BYT27DRAFT_7208808 [Phlegmacium glaucopus]